MSTTSEHITVYISTPHPCNYLPGKTAAMVFLDFERTLVPPPYPLLIHQGFRRSGAMVYRPRCEACGDCASVRIPVDYFRPRRNQQRAWKRNEDLETVVKPAAFDEEHFMLFSRYQAARHPDGPMAAMTPEEYLHFLTAGFVETQFVEIRRAGGLLGVMVIDVLRDCLSSVYTFFEPTEPARSLGTWAILWQIAEARTWAIPWVYLGYWIPGCRKMDYKGNYRPLEVFRKGKWVRLPGTGESRKQQTGPKAFR